MLCSDRRFEPDVYITYRVDKYLECRITKDYSREKFKMCYIEN